ncbi:MAG: hypothetical protein GKR97_20030 [Rhizobiaceae bacterium]|nr:hypothetical protein [Rhizobiaceae bacterium]
MCRLISPLLPRLHLCCTALAVLILIVQAPIAAAQNIAFPQDNVSDLRGLLNVFHTFNQACLKQPAHRDLPAKLAPDGYQVVSGLDHLWGPGSDASTDKVAVLTKTGTEQGDWDGGHLFVEFSMPTGPRPNGKCTVKWKRAWDYKEGRAKIAFGLFGVFDAQVSYHLRAVLNSRPDDSFIWKRKTFAGVSDWISPCWGGKFCNFQVLYDFNPDRGIDISITRETTQP